MHKAPKEILSCATDCHAACVADLQSCCSKHAGAENLGLGESILLRLLLAGDEQQRQRAREYAYFLRGKHEGAAEF